MKLQCVVAITRRKRALLLAILTGVGLASPGAMAAESGYYTTAQAEAGQQLFGQKCAICHGEQLQGKIGPALAGATFLNVSQFQEITADFLFRMMSRQMPANAPGSLSKDQYLDLLAYVLQANGYPAGSSQLTADDKALTQIKIEPTGQPEEKK